MKFADLLPRLEAVCRKTGDFILAEKEKVSGKDIELKSLNSLVSYVDKKAEEQLVSGLGAILPEAGFITEEDTPDSDARLRWVIDPLDGTTNYLHGIPVFAISVALMDGPEVVLGCVYELGQKEMFLAAKGHGTTLNGKMVRVNQKELSETLIATGFPYYNFARMDGFLAMLKRLFKETRGVRRLGSAATDLAYVACGRFDGFFEYGLSPWDVAAGALLVKEAGGQVSDFSGEGNYIFGGEILAASASTYEAMQALTDEYFRQ